MKKVLLQALNGGKKAYLRLLWRHNFLDEIAEMSLGVQLLLY